MNMLLHDLLKQAKNPKILYASTVNINWFRYPKRRIEFDNLQGEHHDTRPYSAYKMYGDSKMSLTMQAFKLAEEFQPDGIAVNALLIPDIHHSKASLKNMSFIPRMLGTLMNPFLPRPDVIAQNYFRICTSQEFDQVTGKLITHKYDIVEAPKYAYDAKNVEQNWEVSQRIISAWVNL